MKKTLLAAALLAGFAGVAQAETSVTLYGILDTGIGYQNIRGNGAIADQSKIGMLTGVQNGSRWGLRGSEDLGDGLRAVFTIESGFNSGDGNSAQGGRLFGRQATVGLASNSWGQLDFGRQTNVASKFFGSIDPFAEGFGLANIGTVFSSSNTTRYDNMVLYQSPVFGGFQVGAGYSFNIDDTNAAQTGFNTNNNQRAITTGLRYVNGPLNLAAAYDQVNRNTAVADAATDGSGDRIRAWLLGGAYDFEVVKVSAAYGQTKGGWIQATSLTGLFTSGSPDLNGGAAGNGGPLLPTNTYSDDFKTQQWMLGLSAPIGGATSVFGSWQRANVKDSSLYTGGQFVGEDSNMNVYSVGVTYDLSKRTNLYALGSYTNNYGFVDGLKSTLVGVGIRHRF